MDKRADEELVALFYKSLPYVKFIDLQEGMVLGEKMEKWRKAKEALKRYLDDELKLNGKKLLVYLRHIKEGEAAKKRLIASALRLVGSIARKHAPLATTLSVMDLIQEGFKGLHYAAERFEKRPLKFVSYARWWIRQKIQRALEKDKILNMPRVTGGKKSGDFMDSFPGADPQRGCESIKEARELIREAMDLLTPRQREVLLKRFGFEDGRDYSFEEIGQMLGITRQGAQQIGESGLRNLALNKKLQAL
ncbi:MAG: sigma-70 family RNA polymerase sigma factor [bacterium]|nr:sigma-70 family RNA polymerase sigma factor [bacterium]